MHVACRVPFCRCRSACQGKATVGNSLVQLPRVRVGSRKCETEWGEVAGEGRAVNPAFFVWFLCENQLEETMEAIFVTPAFFVEFWCGFI
jgi:hypothetical protein